MIEITLVLGTIDSVAKAITEWCRFAQTDEGQALLKEMREGRIEFKKGWEEFWNKMGVKT